MRVVLKVLVQIELDTPTAIDGASLLPALEIAALTTAHKHCPSLAYRIDVIPEEWPSFLEPDPTERAAVGSGRARLFSDN